MWGFSSEHIELLKQATTFDGLYHNIYQCSNVVTEGVTGIIDKTPAYQNDLKRIAATYDVPIIVMVKDPVLLWASHMKYDTYDFCHQMVGYYKRRMEETHRAMKLFPTRVMLVRHEVLVESPQEVMNGVFRHVGLDPVDVSEFDSPFPQVHGNRVNANEVAERYKTVPAADRVFIQDKLAKFCYYTGD